MAVNYFFARASELLTKSRSNNGQSHLVIDKLRLPRARRCWQLQVKLGQA